MDNHEIIQKVRAGMDTVDGRLVELLQENDSRGSNCGS